jgi:hypothetical protein
MSNKEDLPSINDYLEDSELPSYKDFIEEEKELPSVEEYKTHIEEETIEDANGNTFAEVIDVIKAPEWQELVKLVNDVRKDIPEIPEIKSYDEEIGEISEKIAEIQENFSQYDLKSDKIYDLKAKNEQFEVKLSEIEQKIPEVPEVRYYEGDIELIYSKIKRIKEEIESLPEVKYYENDLDVLKSRIEEVNDNIPTFPKWVNEVNEVPDFSWIGKTFGVIDDDFKKVESNFDLIKDTIASRVSELIETIEVKDFEQKVDFKDFKNVYSESKDKIYKELKEITLRIYDHKHEFKDDDRKLKKAILGEQNKLKQTLETEIKRINKESVKTDETILSYFTNLKEEVSKKFDSLPEIKHYDNEIDSLKQDVKFVKVSVKSCLEDIKKISADIKKTQVDLAEGLLNEPPSQRETAGGQTDPLTPLDQKFATLDDLSKHYRLFVNRIQTQLSTMGGGGAGFIKDLDDVSFAGVDNQLLIYNATTSKWVGIGSDEFTAVGAAGTWGVDSVGIHTTKIVGINTTTAKAGVALHVVGDIEATGNVNVAGTITYDDVKHVDSLGLSTFRSGVEVNTGAATTALLVRGDARITGILTIGTASVTIDGDNNTITTGIVTITNSDVTIGDNVRINAGATGINSAPNVFYVAKDGDDSNNGTSIDNAKLTIASAVGVAQSGSVIKVLSGNYVESNPIVVPAFVAIVGDDLRSVKVLPSNTTQDLFHVNKGCKLANMTFSGHVHPSAAVAFPNSGATNVGGGKWKGPYIQNCTSDTTTGTGIRVDGNKAVKTKSMNVDAFTQYNQGGVGVAVTNEGYAQLVSVFTICCNEAITVHKGGQADVANSNCSFGTFGLIADGVSNEQFTGIVTASGAAGQDNIVVNVGAVTTRPYDGQVVYFDQLYKSVESITITNGGSGYTSTPSVTITSPTGPNGEVATAFATIENGVVTEIDIISSGSQYTGTATITISAPDSGITATATAVMADTYYTINSATPIVSGITTLTLAENLLNTVGVASTAYFFQQSKIIASSHTFEYIGAGNNITSATPKRGGVTIQANEVKSQNGGRVIYTSTDQAGNFRIGDDLQINQSTGTISGRAFSKSLFSEMTPFILALS